VPLVLGVQTAHHLLSRGREDSVGTDLHGLGGVWGPQGLVTSFFGCLFLCLDNCSVLKLCAVSASVRFVSLFKYTPYYNTMRSFSKNKIHIQVSWSCYGNTKLSVFFPYISIL
jgi:hypothetical protein